MIFGDWHQWLFVAGAFALLWFYWRGILLICRFLERMGRHYREPVE